MYATGVLRSPFELGEPAIIALGKKHILDSYITLLSPKELENFKEKFQSFDKIK